MFCWGENITSWTGLIRFWMTWPLFLFLWLPLVPLSVAVLPWWAFLQSLGKSFLLQGLLLFFSPGMLLCSFGFFSSLVSLSFPLFLFLVNKYWVFTVSQGLPNLTRIPLLSSYSTLFSVMAFVMVFNSTLIWLFVIYMSRFSAPWRPRSYFFCSQLYPITYYSAWNSWVSYSLNEWARTINPIGEWALSVSISEGFFKFVFIFLSPLSWFTS